MIGWLTVRDETPIPPVFLLAAQASIVLYQHLLPFGAPKIVPFNGVCVTPASSHVRDKTLADTIPARLFSFPLKRAAGPRQLLTVVKNTNRTLNNIRERSAW
jgi:hypothetical protein